MVEHAASAEDVEHGVEGEGGVVEPFSSSGVSEELKGLQGVGVAEPDPLEDTVDEVVGEEDPAGFQGLLEV